MHTLNVFFESCEVSTRQTYTGNIHVFHNMSIELPVYIDHITLVLGSSHCIHRAFPERPVLKITYLYNEYRHEIMGLF